MHELTPDSQGTARLLEEIRQGDRQALGRLLERHRDDLHAFVAVRFDTRLAGRADPSDVVQEAQLEVARRMSDFLERRPMPFRVWLRRTAYERLLDLRKHHLRGRRSVRREGALPEGSSWLVARPLLGGAGGSPSEQLAAREFAQRVSRAVAGLPEADQEVLLMRHGEGMPFEEIACVLGIEPTAARKRFGRALIRLQKVLSEQGLLE
jgi:RNA polymerase sigma-70 factor (ECF subfamily)